MTELTGTAANDVLVGTDADDVLNGLAGADKMTGGTGDDRYFVDQAGDAVKELANKGFNDAVVSSISLALAANVEDLELVGGALNGAGNALHNVIVGNSLDNKLDGAAGHDLLSGGLGNDTLTGGTGDDFLVGGAGANLLQGGGGNDLLYGLGGESVMQGGAGDDVYRVDSAGDTVTEAAGQGVDRIEASISFDLSASAANVEHLFLLDTAADGTGNALDNQVFGNQYDNTLDGGAGNDDLFGGGGNDTLTGGLGNDKLDGAIGTDVLKGGAGNDIYFLTSDDSVVEEAGQGTDEVRIDGNIDLETVGYFTGGKPQAFFQASIENVTLLGTGDFETEGNKLDNVVTGNSGDNTLTGREGNDTLIGGDGDDILGGGDGNNALIGGKGDDTYYIETAKDVVTEKAGEGTDIVHTKVSYALGATLEHLVLRAGQIDGTGNALANEIIGSTGGNKIDGGHGDDILSGGDGNDNLIGGAGNDTLYDGAGNDSLLGGDGNDALHSFSGNDTLIGGKGNDTYQLDTPGVILEKANEGIDTVYALFSYTLGANLENLNLAGNGGDGVTGTGNALHNVISGGTGKSTLQGDAGDDTLYGSEGDDTLQGSSGNDRLFGGAQNDHLEGGDGDDYLDGGSGVNKLEGGKGNDTYVIATGTNTIAELANEGIDTVITTATTDLGTAGFENFENLTLSGNAAVNGFGNALNNVLTGNSGDNGLFGNDGDDTLIGGDGADVLSGGGGKNSLIGGRGDDTYEAFAAGDQITEKAKEGNDTVRSYLSSYALGGNIENLEFDGLVGSAVGTGNALANNINGTIWNDKLDGKEGNDLLIGNVGDDTLTGGAGNDTLDGGTGKDEMTGGVGDDRYYVDSSGDKVTELAGQGFDSIYSEISVFNLDANVESLVLLGTSSLDGGGNEAANLIYGNDGNNTLQGLGGNDELTAAGGKDVLDGGTGNDTLHGGDGDDQLEGRDGNDILDGGAGVNQLIGGKGNDIYILSGGTDTIVEGFSDGIDEVRTSLTGTLAALANVENLTLTGTGDTDGTGNALANVIKGNDGDNVLFGAEGNDTLYGGLGSDELRGDQGDDKLIGGQENDFYYVDSAKDVVIELANQGNDKVISKTSYTLGANIERLALDSNADIDGTGNALANFITGGIGRNRLDGAGGDDTLQGGNGDDTLLGGAGSDQLDGGADNDLMKGGAGNDFYTVMQSGDTVVEGAGQGIDTIAAYIDFDLTANGANVENVAGFDTNGIDIVGNKLHNRLAGYTGDDILEGRDGNDTLGGGAGNDRLFGGAGHDSLEGGGGDDILNGGAGNDRYRLADATDTIIELANGGIDHVETLADYKLGANLENMTLLGANDIDGKGNELANVINGNSGSNALFGFAGNDTINGGDGGDGLDGGEGKDVMTGGKGDDIYYVDNVADKVVEKSGEGTFDRVFTTLATYTLGNHIENLYFDVGAINVIGTGNTADNDIDGDAGNDRLDGRAGNDTLFGGEGRDTLIGGDGNDALYGSFGDDSLDGGGGQDTLSGSDGNDTLKGGGGDDMLFGEAGDDLLIGGLGNDTYFVVDSSDVVQELAKGGTDTIRTSIDLTLGANIENAVVTGMSLAVTGNDLNNYIHGYDGADVLSGGKGADLLIGGAGADTLNGGDGDDVIEGSLGVDKINGGAGNDLIRYRLGNPNDLPELGGDLIAGFEVGKDKIDVYDLFEDFGLSTMDVVGAGIMRLLVNNDDTLLQFDKDGGGDGFVTLAVLQNVTNATFADVIYPQDNGVL